MDDAIKDWKRSLVAQVHFKTRVWALDSTILEKDGCGCGRALEKKHSTQPLTQREVFKDFHTELETKKITSSQWSSTKIFKLINIFESNLKEKII